MPESTTVYHGTQMSTIIIIVAAASFALTPLAEILAVKFGAVSRPDMDRKKHVRPTAQWGGVAVYLALLISIAVGCLTAPSGSYSLSLPLLMAVSGGMLCLLGAYDDMFEIRARWKFAGQIVAITPVVLAGYYFERLTLLGFSIELGWMGALWTMAWMLLAINALNLIDGMDGLASIIGIIIAGAIAAIAVRHGQQTVMVSALAVGAALVGFVWHNLPPARIYLGDCGSMVAGFALSLLAMQVSLDTAGSANATVIAMLFFVPLLDTVLAVLRRTLRGKSFAAADHEHIHHKLLDRGIRAPGILALLGGLCLISGINAWLAATNRSEIWTWITLGALLSFLVNRRLIGHQEWSIAKRLMQHSTVLLIRLAASQSPSRPQVSIPRFQWKIIGNQEPGEPGGTIHLTHKDNSWEPPENKAA